MAIDLWSPDPYRDAVCITTNTTLRSNGNAICGAGCAREARTRWPDLESVLGARLRDGPDVLHLLYEARHSEGLPPLVAFPTKRHWREKADLDLIKSSAEQLMKLTEDRLWFDVWLPRPGAGLGGLDYSSQVKPALDAICDERIVVIDFPKGGDARA